MMTEPNDFPTLDERKIQRLDNELVQASKKIKILNALSWPAGDEDKFLESGIEIILNCQPSVFPTQI